MKLEEGEEQDPSLAMGHLALRLLPRTGPVPTMSLAPLFSAAF